MLDGTIGASQLDATLDLSAKTVTLPAASVTPHVTLPSPIQGAIIQTQYTQYDGTSEQTLAPSNTQYALDNLNVDITPTSTSSIIKLEARVMFEVNTALSEYDAMFFFFRDTNYRGAPIASSRRIGISNPYTSYSGGDATSTPSMVALTWFDAPASTSSITYKVGASFRGASLFYLNRTVSDTDTEEFERGVSFISATEIAG